MDGVDVVSKRQRCHVGLATVLDESRLRARTAVGGGDFDIFPGFFLPVFGKGFVELGVEFARRVVADVEKLDGCTDGCDRLQGQYSQSQESGYT